MMNTETTYTAIPTGVSNGDLSAYGGYDEDTPLRDPPRTPLPWTEETNDLYVRLVQCSWDDLLRPDRPRVSLARQALKWFEDGATVDVGRPDGRRVSLFEVWDWPADRFIAAARSRFTKRAELRLLSIRGRSARFEDPANLSSGAQLWGDRLAPELLGGDPDGHTGDAAHYTALGVVADPPVHASQNGRTSGTADAASLGAAACTAGLPVPLPEMVEPEGPVAVQQSTALGWRPLRRWPTLPGSLVS